MVQCAMLAGPVLLVLLPLAAAKAGGPTSRLLSLEGAVSQLLNATLVRVSLNTRLGSVRTATDDYDRLKQCFKDRSCTSLTCDDECPSSLGPDCRDKCRLNCACACDGRPGSSVDNVDAVDKCIAGRACSTRYSACNAGCIDDDSDCLFSCYLEELECMCECNSLPSTTVTAPPTTLNTMPRTSATPATPVTPVTPVAPVTRVTPVTPVTPVAPVTRVTPVTPATPATPKSTIRIPTCIPPFWPNASPPLRPALVVNLALAALSIVFAAGVS